MTGSFAERPKPLLLLLYFYKLDEPDSRLAGFSKIKLTCWVQIKVKNDVPWDLVNWFSLLNCACWFNNWI